jgi:8-oxo-dGTP pyrophosphatase MutT (NUDIX family)
MKTQTWEQQAYYISLALADKRPVEIDALLIPRNASGNLARKMTPEPGSNPRQAAILLLFYPHEDELWFPLTVRSKKLTRHSGEVSFPGGATDPEDDGPPGTALRETHEELGIPPHRVEIWGALTRLYVSVSNFYLTPVVGFTPGLPEMHPCSLEIAEVFGVPLSYVQDPTNIQVEEWVIHDHPTLVPYFPLHGHKVWGATAIILSELLVRLQRAQESHPPPASL